MEELGAFGESAGLCRATRNGDLPDLAAVGHWCRSLPVNVTAICVAGLDVCRADTLKSELRGQFKLYSPAPGSSE